MIRRRLMGRGRSIGMWGMLIEGEGEKGDGRYDDSRGQG